MAEAQVVVDHAEDAVAKRELGQLGPPAARGLGRVVGERGEEACERQPLPTQWDHQIRTCAPRHEKSLRWYSSVVHPLVVGIGHATVDFLGVVPRMPEPDGRAELAQVSIQGGGPAATALLQARLLGCRARFCGKLADDDFGRFILRGLLDAGVDCDGVVKATGRLSPFSFIALADGDPRRTTFWTAGDVAQLEPGELDLPTLLDGAAALLVDGWHPEAQIAACEEAREREIPIVLDAGGLREGMGELVALSDVLVASERFVSEVAPRGEVEDSLVELQEMGPDTVVITLGDSGSVGLFGDKLIRQQAYEVEAVDTTGAGDAFRGAFTAGLVRGFEPELCMQFASAAAALTCRALGGRAGLPDLEEVKTFLGWG
jgi:ribokinase